jgi:hypothetical protein
MVEPPSVVPEATMLPDSSINETVSAFFSSAQILTDVPTERLGPGGVALIPTTVEVWFGGAVGGTGVGVGGGGAGTGVGSGGGGAGAGWGTGCGAGWGAG